MWLNLQGGEVSISDKKSSFIFVKKLQTWVIHKLLIIKDIFVYFLHHDACLNGAFN